jgi:hypothetical protein
MRNRNMAAVRPLSDCAKMKDGSGMGDGSPEGASAGPLRREAYSMNLVGSTYSTGFMIANGYFGSITVLP